MHGSWELGGIYFCIIYAVMFLISGVDLYCRAHIGTCPEYRGGLISNTTPKYSYNNHPRPASQFFQGL